MRIQASPIILVKPLQASRTPAQSNAQHFGIRLPNTDLMMPIFNLREQILMASIPDFETALDVSFLTQAYQEAEEQKDHDLARAIGDTVVDTLFELAYVRQDIAQERTELRGLILPAATPEKLAVFDAAITQLLTICGRGFTWSGTHEEDTPDNKGTSVNTKRLGGAYLRDMLVEHPQEHLVPQLTRFITDSAEGRN